MYHHAWKKLQSADVTVVHAQGDADVLIVTTTSTINAPIHKSVTLIGEDTDLLILLLHHTSLSSNRIIYRSDKTLTKTTKYWKLRLWHKNLDNYHHEETF